MRQTEILKNWSRSSLVLCLCIWTGQDWPLQQGARGTFGRGWGVCWAVAHWQDVVVAGNVAVPREVIRTLGESGC